MHPIYFSHGYREREAPFAAYFSALMAKVGFIPSLDPPSNDVNSAKLERHLSYTNGMVAVLSNRDAGPSPHIIYEISMGLRCNKPTLVFAEDSIPEPMLPKRVIIKRFSERSYIRETTDHLYALERLSAYIGKNQLPRYRGEENQRSCILLGEHILSTDIRNAVKSLLNHKGYMIKRVSPKSKTLPITGLVHSEIHHTNLAISVLTSKSPFNSYVLGALQTTLVPTITLSVGDYPLVADVPEEYQRRIIDNTDQEEGFELIKSQIELFEEDFIEIDSSGKAEKYADKLAESPFQGQYTHAFRTNIIQEVTMGDKYEAGQVGAQGPNAHAHDMTFNQIWQQNKDRLDVSALNQELLALRNSMQSEAKTAEHFAEIGAVASAEIEAGKGNGAKALEALSKAGKWSLGVAEKIGVNVATAALKSAIGI